MKNIITLSTILFLFATTQLAFSQSDKEKALAKGREAIKLMDQGKIDESIKLLEEAQKLDPDMFDYPYELALANYMKKNYKGAIKILEKNKNHKNVSDLLYQLLGNSYDLSGDSKKAFEAYDEGLKKFPNSGKLYLEKGNVHWNKKEYEAALPYYEKGIEVEPKYPSNYYRAALIYCSTTEEVWGMIYGEIFMNLERNSKRTAEISKLLYDTYKSEIKITSDSSMSISFCQSMIMSVDALKNPDKIKLPFCMVFEPVLIMSAALEKSIDINSLDRIRSNFISNYFDNGHDKNYPNVLFSYMQKVEEEGHLESYNHWILMKGDEDAFDKWHAEHKDEWDAFIKWFGANGMKVSESNKFFKAQY